MTTIAAGHTERDPNISPAGESLVTSAFSCVPIPRETDETVTDQDRAIAVHDIASAIASGIHALTEADRRELAAALLPTSAGMSMVTELHRAFGLPIADTSRTNSELRSRLIREEAEEASDELLAGNTVALAKELADVLYVTYGTAVTEGIDLDGALRAVHESNMSKLVNGKPIMREDGKFLKGPNYVEPDMRGFVPVRHDQA